MIIVCKDGLLFHKPIISVISISPDHFCCLFNRNLSRWFSGIIQACQAWDPGSIPGRDNYVFAAAQYTTEHLQRQQIMIWPHRQSNHRSFGAIG